jgi:hypothetical protein
MSCFVVYRWFSRFFRSCKFGVALLLGALIGLPLLSVSAQEAFRQPDYSKFPAESGPIMLEVWSWVSGFANDVKDYFVPWTWGQMSPDGKAVYGIPQDTGPMALLYNKKIFDQYGLTVPTWQNESLKNAKGDGYEVKAK